MPKNVALRFVPAEERPRERLLKQGAGALSLAELLAVLLSTGTKGKSVLDLAHEMIIHFGGLQGLLDASYEELMAFKGMGPAKALLIQAALGIARRASERVLLKKNKIESPLQAYQLIKNEIGHCKQEVLGVLLRDVRGRMICFEKISIGTLSEVLVHPREVFYPAVRCKAHSIIIAHNHPSGDPTPSQADLALTKLLIQSSKVMGIELDDHIILGLDAFVSLQEKGIFASRPNY